MSCRIAELESKKQGTLIILDNGEQIWISRHLLGECPLSIEQEGEIDPDVLKEWMMPRQYQSALHYAVDLLAKQDRASGEIKQKLEAKKYLPDTIEMVLYKLETEHFLNDQTFAKNYAQAKSRAHVGKNKIRWALKQKGIDRETIDEAIDAINVEEAAESAVHYAKQLIIRYRKEPDPRKRQQKALAAMARRGYDYENSRSALAAAADDFFSVEDEQ